MQFGRDIFDLLTDGLLTQDLEISAALRTVHFVIRCVAFDLAYRKIFDDLHLAGALALPGEALWSSIYRLLGLTAGFELDLVEQR